MEYITIIVRLISKVYLCLIAKQNRIPTVFLLSTDSKIDRPKQKYYTYHCFFLSSILLRLVKCKGHCRIFSYFCSIIRPDKQKPKKLFKNSIDFVSRILVVKAADFNYCVIVINYCTGL